MKSLFLKVISSPVIMFARGVPTQKERIKELRYFD
jgi:hypothetical protein